MLHLTKIAFQVESPASLAAWLAGHAEEARLTTRYLPKRHAELFGGSLFWIHGGALVGRSPLLGFAVRPDGKWWIRLAPRLIAVAPVARRAHQGWRYLAAVDAPADLAEGAEAAMPATLLRQLSGLGIL